ncbi:MAG: ComF family protein [Lentisphaeraceae bacterium]|nr:ComF family protein [Lentisphaeraceae bacterium]
MTRARRRLLRWRCRVQRLLEAVLDLLFPRDCALCQGYVPTGHLCPACRKRLREAPLHTRCPRCGEEFPGLDAPATPCAACREHPPAFRRALIALRYDDNARALIHAFKYHRGIHLTADFVRLLRAKLRRELPGMTFSAVVPVPITRAKLRSRGYNQAELLARALARRLGLPCLHRLLVRHETGVFSQTRLHRAERLANAREAYALAPRAPSLAGQRLLLVDDVMTTGATAQACAEALASAGAEVYLLALARPLR